MSEATHSLDGHEEMCARPLRHEGPCAPEMTKAEAASILTSSGHGMTTDGLSDYYPAVQCTECRQFVGRDGSMSVCHFEASSEVAWVEGQCRRCLTKDTQ